MADFPSLEPVSRSLTYGDYPQLTHEGISGGDVRFLMSTTDRVAQRLTLGYENLTEAEAKLLLDHYEGQEGSLIAFDLPAGTVWAGFTSVPVSASDYQWRYIGAFDVGLSAPLQYGCTIELETVPI